MSTIEDLAQRFDADRRHLRSVAFHLLGSVADAEDAVQSAWLKASRADYHLIENLTGWFTTITAREAFDQLRARNRRAGRVQALLQIGIEAGRIHTIDIVGDADRLDSAVIALPQ